jgi:hypothetical protein
VKFKIAFGNDIRRLKRPLDGMDELQETTRKIFGKRIKDDEQRYFYYDSDEDRINISDDEDLESAVDHWVRNTLKIYVENYSIKKDPFFSRSSSQKADQKTGASSDRSKPGVSEISKVVFSARSLEESIEIEEHKESKDDIDLTSIKETVSCSEESDQEHMDDFGEINPFRHAMSIQSDEKSKISMRKNTEVEQHNFEMLEEQKPDKGSNSIPRK